MRTFILLSFGLLGLAYWGLSGGAAFVPEPWPAAAEADPPPEAGDAPAVVATTADPAPGALMEVTAAPDPAPAPAAAAPPELLSPDDALAALAPADPDDAAPGAPPAAPAGAPSDVAASPAAPAVAADPAPDAVPDLRTVTGDRVNMREGPGTGFSVVGQLAAGDAAEVLEEDGNWARVRVAATGAEGWMSLRFLAPAGG